MDVMRCLCQLLSLLSMICVVILVVMTFSFLVNFFYNKGFKYSFYYKMVNCSGSFFLLFSKFG